MWVISMVNNCKIILNKIMGEVYYLVVWLILLVVKEVEAVLWVE